jgi:hypothetical protein
MKWWDASSRTFAIASGCDSCWSSSPAEYVLRHLGRWRTGRTPKPLVVLQDLGPIQVTNPRIRGVLGENFLAHFDVLIDYAGGLLCLDEAKLWKITFAASGFRW